MDYAYCCALALQIKMSISDMNAMHPKTFFAIINRIGKLNKMEDKKDKRKVSAEEMRNFIK